MGSAQSAAAARTPLNRRCAAAAAACRVVALALLPLLAAAVHDQQAQHTELVSLASAGDVVQLWQRATDAAAAAVVDALRQQLRGASVELKGADLDGLRIWRGQTVTLAVEADGQPFKFVVQSEPEWRRLAEVLPAKQVRCACRGVACKQRRLRTFGWLLAGSAGAAVGTTWCFTRRRRRCCVHLGGCPQGGLLPAHDWDAIQSEWLSPVARGSLLPDFALEGPVDVYLATPTALQVR